MFKTQIIFISLSLVSSFVFFEAGIYASPKPSFKVVIDAGHGGLDEGTVFYQRGKKISEKEITLKLALQTARYLRSQGISVILTRSKDKEVSLADRTAIANRLGADIFISLHMNSTPEFSFSDAEGIETYILNNATDASSRRLAHLENSVISKQKVDSDQNDVALILKDLRLDANLAESKRLACQIQSSLVKATSLAPTLAKSKFFKKYRRRNRGVKQALFHVLLGADMPSVLVEAGFMSSSYDRSFVLSRKGQPAIGKAIAKAIEEYRQFKGVLRPTLALNQCKMAPPAP